MCIRDRGGGVRTGGPDQHVYRRCHRQDRDAADRRGLGARMHHRAAQPRDRRSAAQRIRARAPRRGGGRGLSALLHPRRGDRARPLSLRPQYDGRDGRGDRRRLHPARLSLGCRGQPLGERRDFAAEGAGDRASAAGRHHHDLRTLVLTRFVERHQSGMRSTGLIVVPVEDSCAARLISANG